MYFCGNLRFFLRNQRETRPDNEKINDKREKIKDDDE
jgi:hypothetical protein